jgi:CDP-4-dehydro-6-deoxyglucose reductase/ferredoxin-NAD(P)+ reductase (naphthalene dioxygenase ferredoxin-specific)
MAFRVAIRQHGAPVEVEMGQTILDAALAAGVPYPHGCRSGNCGACKSRLSEGDVEMTPYSEFALTEAEAAEGLVLACRAVPWSDAAVEWLDPGETVVHPLRRLTCRVAAIENATHDIRRIRLEIVAGGPFSFSAGQYASVIFEGQAPRDYSMANRPDETLLEFHIRRMGRSGASHYVAERLAPGDLVRVEGPYGSSHLRESHTGPIVAIAGGSGLAPLTSIVEQALALGKRQPITLYFGVRDEPDLYLERHFTALAASHPNFRFVPVLSEPSGSTRRRTGFVHEAVAADWADFDGVKAYLAGPPVMVEAATTLLQERGMRRADIHADAFYTEAEKAALVVAPERVT